MLKTYYGRGIMEDVRRCCPDIFEVMWKHEVRPILLLETNLVWSAFWIDSHVRTDFELALSELEVST
jgi:hypothetical protein